MKRKFAVILFILIIALCVAVFVGCKDEGENNPNKNSVLQFDGATVDENNKIEVTVDRDVKSVKLVDKITVKDGYTWKLYADKMGVVEIPTKVAANAITAELLNGDNEFCIVVSSADDKETIVYELTIFRNHDVYVNYEYNGKIVKTDIAETNSTYNISIKGNENFFDDGFVFNGWTDKNGNKVTTTIDIEKENIVLTADLKGKTTTVTLDANGGELFSNTTVITYGKTLFLPEPQKEGHRFGGWLLNEDRFTTYDSNYSTELTLTAVWYKQWYRAYVTNSDPTLSVRSTINYDFNYSLVDFGEVAIARTDTYNNSYTWLGWYENGELLSTELTYEFTMPAHDVYIEARWEWFVTKTYLQFSDNEPTELQDFSYVQPEETISITLPEVPEEKNVTAIWLGWYINDELFSSESTFDYVVPYSNVTIVGKYKLLTLDNDENITVINYSQTNNSVNAGENALLVALPYKGYRFIGWYKNNELLSDSTWLRFDVPYEDTHIETKCELLEEMNNLVFTSDENECYVSDIKDKSLTDIVIPDCVTEIKGGLLAECHNLVNLTIPFAGQRAYAQLSVSYLDSYELKYYFGHFFGSYNFEGGIRVQHTLREDRTTSYFYVPGTLKSVTILGGNIRHGAFSNCTMLTSVTIGANVKSIGIGAFVGCTNLTEAIFENQENWKLERVGSMGTTGFSTMANTYQNADRLVATYSNYLWRHE